MKGERLRAKSMDREVSIGVGGIKKVVGSVDWRF